MHQDISEAIEAIRAEILKKQADKESERQEVEKAFCQYAQVVVPKLVPDILEQTALAIRDRPRREWLCFGISASTSYLEQFFAPPRPWWDRVWEYLFGSSWCVAPKLEFPVAMEPYTGQDWGQNPHPDITIPGEFRPYIEYMVQLFTVLVVAKDPRLSVSYSPPGVDSGASFYVCWSYANIVDGL